MERETRIASLSRRRPKWQYPQAPAPRILHLPLRRKKKPQPSLQQQLKFQALKRLSSLKERKGKLETFFDQERVFSGERRRERVEEEEREGAVVVEEEKWRFQAEMLRAECNLLRMEREISVRKMERRRVKMVKALTSAVQILVSGQQRIYDGKNATKMVGEVQELIVKMEKLQRRIRAKDLGMRSCSNFDRQVSHLQRRLEKFGREPDEIGVKEIQEMAEASLSVESTSKVEESCISNGSCNMENLRKEMEKLSKKTLFERIKEEYRSMLSTTNSSAASSASNSNRNEYVEAPPTSTLGQTLKEMDKKACSGCCKVIVTKVVEQVRAETEQWSQMQEMLVQVREEMEELQASREYWEDRALDSDSQMRCLRSSVEEWRKKAIHSEFKANELLSQVSILDKELKQMKKVAAQATSTKNPPIHSQEMPSEMEKRVLVCRVKENNHRSSENGSKRKEIFSEARRKALSCSNGIEATRRSPFREIGNSSLPMRQNGRSALYLHCPLPPIVHEKF